MLSASPALAGGQSDCNAAQLKQIGRYSNTLYKCLSRATKRNTGAGECVAKASEKLSKNLEKIQDDGDCQVPTDFDALNLGLQSSLDRDANAIQQSLRGSSAEIQPCETNIGDVYEVNLAPSDQLVASVDTIDNEYYFDPGLVLRGVTNATCVAGDRPLDQLMTSNFKCTFDPNAPNANLLCPRLQITGTMVQDQVCSLIVFVENENACQDSTRERADYRLDVFINGNRAVVERVQSDLDFVIAP